MSAMKHTLSILVLLLVAVPAHGQLFAEASRTLREADHARMVFGDLDRATVLYRKVAESPSASRADVARALYSLAAVAEMSNRQQAVEMYQRITTEFPDMSASFQAARESLQRLGSDADVAVRDYQLVMEEMRTRGAPTARRGALQPVLDERSPLVAGRSIRGVPF
jgi:tetratricopeptide (TPR) repeat protein